jgi:hypothetical protein
MTAIYEHPSYAGRIDSRPTAQAPGAPTIESVPDARVARLATAARSCCCIAKPAVVALIPARPGRPVADLLLCMHHYRAHRQALATRGARILDGAGLVLTDQDVW